MTNEKKHELLIFLAVNRVYFGRSSSLIQCYGRLHYDYYKKYPFKMDVRQFFSFFSHILLITTS